MTYSMKLALCVLIAYVITRLGYFISGFNPTLDLKAIPGYAIDISIWIIVFFGVRWIVDKVLPTKNSTTA
ncbi:MAG TPA: hypothetical protein PKZ40_05665 [Anaerolineaceae bacterium]|nr:hypothetical protein [Anaerolineaceae bacterium]